MFLGKYAAEVYDDMSARERCGDEDEYPSYGKELLYCKYCYALMLRWHQTDAGWRLMDKTGAIHSCEEYRVRQEYNAKCARQQRDRKES